MYEMKVVASSLFKVMIFPHGGKIFTINQLTYYEKKTLNSSDVVLPFVRSSPVLITTYTEFGPGQFKTATLLGTYPINPSMLEDTPLTTRARCT